MVKRCLNGKAKSGVVCGVVFISISITIFQHVVRTYFTMKCSILDAVETTVICDLDVKMFTFQPHLDQI